MSLIKAVKDFWTEELVPGQGNICKECVWRHRKDTVTESSENTMVNIILTCRMTGKLKEYDFLPNTTCYAGKETCGSFVAKPTGNYTTIE